MQNKLFYKSYGGLGRKGAITPYSQRPFSSTFFWGFSIPYWITLPNLSLYNKISHKQLFLSFHIRTMRVTTSCDIRGSKTLNVTGIATLQNEAAIHSLCSCATGSRVVNTVVKWNVCKMTVASQQVQKNSPAAHFFFLFILSCFVMSFRKIPQIFSPMAHFFHN